MLWNWPQLYASLVDVSDVAEPIGKGTGRLLRRLQRERQGRRQVAAVPHGWRQRGRVSTVVVQRDRRQRIPKTWDEYREVGKKLKAKGKPIGQALGHSFGDPPVFSYAFLWDFGGAGGRPERQEGRINSKARSSP
jgi:multiple sugar transport system substrate-binding protein